MPEMRIMGQTKNQLNEHDNLNANGNTIIGK